MFALFLDNPYLAHSHQLPATTVAIELAVKDRAASATSDVSEIGTILAGGVECPLAALDDGRVYALAGIARGRFAPGTRIRIRGIPVRVSNCMQGQTLKVIEVDVIVDPSNVRHPDPDARQEK